MTEEKKVDTTTTEKEVDDKKTEEVKTEVETTEEKSNIEKTTDYTTKLKQIEDAEKKLADDKFHFREEKRKEKEASGDENLEEKEYLTKDDLDEVLSKQSQQIEAKVEATQVDSMLTSLTGSEEEKNFVKKILSTTKFPDSFSLEQRVSSAVAVANADKLVGENSELKRALKSKDGVSNDASSSTSKGQKDITPSHITAELEGIFKAQGMTFNDETRRFEKKLPSGKTQFYDEKSKTYIVK